MDGEGLMTYSGASHQGAIKRLWHLYTRSAVSRYLVLGGYDLKK